MGEREAETEEGNEMTGESTGTGTAMIGKGAEVEVEIVTGGKTETGTMIMNEIENIGEIGTVIGTESDIATEAGWKGSLCTPFFLKWVVGG